jgi:AcrR family transcriptional regulator
MASKGDRRRERILEVVAELIRTQPLEEISIAEITRRAEVTRPAFYFYFPTKGAAMAALMEGLFPEFMAAASVWYEHRAVDQVQGLREGMESTVALWRKHPAELLGMVQASVTDAEARVLWDRWVLAFTARALPTITADLGPRRARRGADPEQLTTFLVDATFAAMQRDVRSIVEDGVPTPGLSETLVQVWTRTLYGR